MKKRKIKSTYTQKGSYSRVKSTIIYLIGYLLIISILLGISYAIIQFTLAQNMKARTFDELGAKVKMQVTMIEQIINREYAQLHLIDSVLIFPNDEIEKEQFQKIWTMMQEKEDITMLGFSDLSGNVIDCNGKEIGNISDEEFFKDIVEGRAEEKCVLLRYVDQPSDSELLYAIPFYLKEKMGGVLFKSKKITNVEDSLMEDIQFDGNASMFLIDSKGDILLVGDENDRFLLEQNLFENEETFYFTDTQKAELKKGIKDKKSGEVIFRQKNKVKYAVYTPSGVENWTIFSTVDKDTAIVQYKKNDEVIERSMIAVLVLFLISLIVTILSVILHIKKQRQVEIEQSKQYHTYRQLMNELESPVFQYSIQDDRIIGNKKYQEAFGHRSASDFMKNAPKWKKIHPEFNFDGFFAEIENVIQNQKIIMFESMLQLEQKNYWIKNILVPVKDEQGGKSLVLGTVMDTTKEHELFDEATEIMAGAQIGIYRFHMKESFRIEYVNESLQKMLGYSEEEIQNIMREDEAHLKFLEVQDRDRYTAFVRRVTEIGGNDTCEYTLICKDGTQLKVSDTLEMKDGVDGDKYGYGVVIDVSKYRDAQKRAEQNLEELKIQLNESRIKISTGQIQPHFLYNALASIREIVLENPEYAADLIFDFTTHLRACIKSMASEEFTSFHQEIENIKAYVNIEKMRFGDKLQVQYDIQESDFNLVPLSIQPLVENAIRHGIYERGSVGGVVKISSYRDVNDIVIKVEDNGVGFDVDKIQQEVQAKTRDSTGLQSLIFRFEKLMHAKVKVESVVGEGTSITVRIPTKGEINSESNYRR